MVYFTVILYGIMLLLVVTSHKKVKTMKQLIQKIGFSETKISDGIKTAIIYLFLMIITAMLIGIIFNAAGLGSDVEKVSTVIKGTGIITILFAITIGAFIEEIFFRGYLQTKTNILITAFIFAYFHIGYGSIYELVGTFALGIILGYEFKKTKNLFAPVLTHLLYNIIIITLTFVFL